MSEVKKKEVKTPDAVDMVKATTAIEVIDKPKSTKPEKGSPEAKEKMAELREHITPDSIAKASETRQRTSAFRNALEKAGRMEYKCPHIGDTAIAIWNQFHNNGLDSFTDAISIAMYLKAANGDVEAAKFVRDTLGEKPVEETNHGGNIIVTLAPTIPKDWME